MPSYQLSDETSISGLSKDNTIDRNVNMNQPDTTFTSPCDGNVSITVPSTSSRLSSNKQLSHGIDRSVSTATTNIDHASTLHLMYDKSKGGRKCTKRPTRILVILCCILLIWSSAMTALYIWKVGSTTTLTKKVL